MTMRSRRRIREMVLAPAFFIVLLVMGIQVRAADHPGWKALSEGISLDSETGLNKIAPGQYYMTADLGSQNGFLVKDGDVDICLHGHKAVLTGNYGFYVRNGATLTITACKDGDNLLLSRPSSSFSSTVDVKEQARLVVNGGTIKCENGYAVNISAGTLELNRGTLSGGTDGVYMRIGDVSIHGGNVVGSAKYGMSVLNTSVYPANVSITGGTVRGRAGGIYAVGTGTGECRIDVAGGEIKADTSDGYCIYQKTQNGGMIISGGKFSGTFPPGMNAVADSGYYSDRTIEPYVRTGYECKENNDTNYPFRVARRTYTVVFKDGFGNTIKTETVLYGESASAPADPVHEGYIFDGWDRSFTGITETDSVVTVNARWKSPAGPDSSSAIYSGAVTPESPAKLSAVESVILSQPNDKDITGSTFSLLQAKGTAKSKTAVTLSWKRVKGAAGYIVYGNKCGKANRYQKIATVTGTSFTHKKLKKGTYYKYIVAAVSNDSCLAVSKTVHVATKGGKAGNNTNVTLNRKKLSLKKGKTGLVKATLRAGKLKVKIHRKVAFESTNAAVASVSKNGKIKARRKGTCYVYAYAQNGLSAKVKIVVK